MNSDSQPLRRKTTSEEITDRLRGEIQRGELEPGTRLRQTEVAERLGVSTTPVREALAQLQAEGLIRMQRHRGAVVFRPTADDLREAHAIREVLETFAIEMAIPRLSTGDLVVLERILEEMQRTDDTERWIDLNHRFHLTIYAASDMPRLCDMIASLRDASSAYLHMFAELTNRAERGDEEHAEILAACSDRDIERAKRWTRLHVQNTVRALLDVLNETAHDSEPEMSEYRKERI
jgi:DNA-binding GntR family transcriptional regulator